MASSLGNEARPPPVRERGRAPTVKGQHTVVAAAIRQAFSEPARDEPCRSFGTRRFKTPRRRDW